MWICGFLDAMAPLIRASQVLGVATYRVIGDELVTSRAMTCYCFITMMVFIGFRIVMCCTIDLSAYEKVSAYLCLLFMNALILIYNITCSLSCLLYRTETIAMLKMLHNLDRLLVRNNRKHGHLFLALVLQISLIIILLASFVALSNMPYSGLQYLFFSIIYSIESARLCMMVLQFSNIVYLSGKLISNFNARVHNLEREKIFRNEWSLCKCHDALCEIVDRTNSIYSPTLLVFVTLAFFLITTAMYIAVRKFVKSNDVETELNYITSLIWLTLYLVMLFLVTHSCETTVNQGDRTAVLVHRAMANTKDVKTKEELQFLSLQLLHRKVKFTAWGFFPLDFTVLYSIVGAVTTYLIILMQTS